MLSLLKQQKHQNIVHFKEIIFSGGIFIFYNFSDCELEPGRTHSEVYFVFDYVETDLSGLICPGGPRWQPSLPEIKCVMKQLLEALHCLHSHVST
jgi:hypothetical protein